MRFNHVPLTSAPLIVALLAMLSSLFSAQSFGEPASTAYKPISAAARSKVEHLRELPTNQIEVIEFFSYHCPHCQTLDPMMHEWQQDLPKDVVLTFLPVSYDKLLEHLAKGFFAASELGYQRAFHLALFNAIHHKGMRLDTQDDLVQLAQSVGIDGAKFKTHYNSFSVDRALRRSQQLALAYQIHAIPTITVNGRFVTAPSMNANYPSFFETMDQLIERERARIQAAD